LAEQYLCPRVIRRSLALKLGLILGVLAAAAFSAAAALLIYTASRALIRQTGTAALGSTYVVAENIGHEMLENTTSQVGLVFRRVTRDTDMEELYLFGADGRLVTSAVKGQPISLPLKGVDCRSCHGKEGMSGVPVSSRGTDTVWVIQGAREREKMRAVVHIENERACLRCHAPEKRVLGLLVGHISLLPAQQTARQMIFWSLASGGGVFVLLILCMTLLVRRLVHRPLTILDENMARLGAGQLDSRLPPLGYDEVGHIAQGFNYMAEALQEKVQRLEALATTDYLTSLLNHRAFQERLETESSRALRYSRCFSLLMLDIDHFKRINDIYGHQAGDEILRQLALQILGNCRETDVVARYGGEEFAVILPETRGDQAQAMAERMRSSVEAQPFTLNNAEPIRLTVSVGVADFPFDSSRPEGLVMAADLALLRAKNISRNCVCTYSALSRLGKIDDPYLLHRYLEEGTVESVIALVEVMENRDPYVRGHSRRVTDMALEVGKRMRLSESEYDSLREAGLLHDVGKIGIPVGILNKPSALTETEWRYVETHPGVGGAVMKAIGRTADLAPVITHHHERYDGTGYPDRLKGEEIPLLARIIAAADATDAMLSARPYRPPFTFEEAVAELERQAGSQFDPQIVEVLVAFLREKVEAPATQK